MSSVKFEDLLSEILRSFVEISDKQIILKSNNDNNKISINRSPELIYGLRNFIGNAVKFSSKVVEINLNSDQENILIEIQDDGPGFPEDIIKRLGEPYIKSKSQREDNKSGLGLGSFLGKTLLERQGAKVNFSNNSKKSGAIVKIYWSPKRFNPIS
tara:strand:- start:69 stop:536 length:468 start_codon:yes stop_codon:yes gene_type:complete